MANSSVPLAMETVLIKEEAPEDIDSEMVFKDEPLDVDYNSEEELHKNKPMEDIHGSCDRFLKMEPVDYDSDEDVNDVDPLESYDSGDNCVNASPSNHEYDGSEDDQNERRSHVITGDDTDVDSHIIRSRGANGSGHSQAESEVSNIGRGKPSGGPYRCPLCLKEYKREASLGSHLKLHETTPEKHKCNMCWKSFKSPKMLARHEESHGKQVYKCNLCPHETQSRRERLWHQKTHKVYWCALCGVEVRTVQDCTEHQQTERDLRRGSYQCGVCTRKCSSMDGFFDHRKMHAEAKCYDCGKTTTLRSLVLHKLMHIGTTLFECEVCYKKFSQRCTLRLHKNSHANKVLHRCKVCHQGFSWFSDLARHRKIHGTCDTLALVNAVKREASRDLHKCSICSDSFHDFIEYCRHIQSHWQGKDVHLKCTICNSNFTTLAHLLNHRKNHK